jgi:L-threonylcarbamoyladenylate synthase
MIGQDLLLAQTLLEKGEVVAIPTETVYGLAGNACDENAVLKIFEIKNRPHFDPLIVHFGNIQQLKNYVLEIPEKAQLLMDLFWPGPLTILLYKNDKTPFLITSGSDKVAVRIPNHPLTLQLLNQLNFPLAAPSANPFGYISPTKAIHVEKQLGDKIPYIIDGGSCDIGLESSIIDCTEQPFKILRLGGLSIETIEKGINEKVDFHLTQNSNPAAPGQLDKHYSPRTPFKLVEDFKPVISQNQHKSIAFITFGQAQVDDFPFINLSQNGDINEAAKHLFDTMRILDEQKHDVIYAQLLPETGLGKAINDRLRRAAAKG